MSSVYIEKFAALFGYEFDQKSAKQVEKSLKDTSNSVTSLGGQLAKLAIGGGLALLAKSQINAADHINDTADTLGVSTQKLQQWNYAATLSASNADELSQAMTILQRNSQEAANGSAELQKAFKTVGVSAGQLKKGISVDELLEKIADKMQKIQNPSKRTALAMQLLGKSGAKLIPLLSQGSEGIAELRKEFVRLGLGFDQDFIKNSAEVNDNLDKLRFTTQGFASQIGAGFLPALNRALTKLFELGTGLLQFTKNTELFNAALTIGAAVLLAYGIAALWANRAQLKLYGTIGLILAVFDELFTMLKGGKTVIGSWIDKWAGLGTVDSLVRSIGQGLKIINETFEKGTFWKTLGSDLEETINGTARRQKRINSLKAQVEAEQDPEKKQALVQQLVKALRNQIDYQDAFTGNTPRATGQGVNAAQEQVRAGEATASAVNEGGFKVNPFSAPNQVATTNSRGETVMITQTNNTEVNVTATTNADPKEIAKEVKKAQEDKDKSSAEQLNALRRNR